MENSIKNHLFLFLLLTALSVIAENQEPTYLDWFYQLIGLKLQQEEKPKEELLNFQKALQKLDSFINEELAHIDNKIDPATKVYREGFIVTEWLPDEQAITKLEQIVSTIKDRISAALPDELERARASVQEKIEALTNARESLSYAQSLIAQSDEELYRNIERSFRHLDQYQIDRTQVYEKIGLENTKRYEYTTEDIVKRADDLNKKLEPNSLQSKQVRQVKFTIGNKVGKKIYDAWLSDKEKGLTQDGNLSMIRIDPTQLDLTEVLDLNTRLMMEKAELDQLKSIIEKTLKEKQAARE